MDLDGTLLDENRQVCKGFNETVNNLYKKGIKVGIATGRNFSSIKFLFPNTYKKLICICCNGSDIYVNDKNIYRSYLKQSTVSKLVDITNENNDISIQFIKPDGCVGLIGDRYVELFGACGYSSKAVSSLYAYTDNLILATAHSEAYPNGFTYKYESLKDELKMATSWFNCIDFMNLNVSKGEGTKIVSDYLKISLDEVMAIGDQDNDLEILQVVGYPVAMLNGNEHVKKIAKDITYKTNIEYGVSDYLNKKFDL